VGMMSISILIADCVMLNCTKEKDVFKKMKELDLKEEIMNKKIETKVPASSSYLLVEDKLSVL
jgi:hypothetical protein